MPVYNLKPVKSPRLCGRLLDLLSRILRLPFFGRLLLDVIKRQNKIHEMVHFAATASSHTEDGLEGEPKPLLPLYYPIHEMSKEEDDMHQHMVKEFPLDLQELSEAVKEQVEMNVKGGQFRHWTISDYTSRYKNGATTPSHVADKIIWAILEMDEQSKSSSIVTQINVKELRRQAAESTKRYQDGNPMGVLDGVPYVVKDEITTAGFRSTLGTSFISNLAKKDAFPIAKLRQQGALLVGKTNQHEIGIGTTGFNLLHGTPRNPYGKDPNVHYYTGGSSSGSAAAVAMGLVPLAIGGDGGGSIRIPSGLCGCVGLKPTFKRVAMDGKAGCSVFHAGPMTNNIHDAALAYAIMAGEADDDHRRQSQKQPPVHLFAYMTNMKRSDSLRGLRIGIFKEHINDADANVVHATKKAIDHYRSKGAEIIHITLPHLQETHRAHQITISSEMFSKMEPYYHSKHFTELCPETRVSLAVGKSWTSTEFLAAQKVRSYAMHQMEDLFKNKVDIILTPATPCCAPQLRKDVLSHGESDLAKTTALMRYVIHGNLTGIPAIVFPIAYDEGSSLPISLQLQAAHWREDLIFQVAKESQGIMKEGIAKPTMYVDILG